MTDDIDKIFEQAYVPEWINKFGSQHEEWKNSLPIPRIEPTIPDNDPDNFPYHVRTSRRDGVFVATKEEAVKLYLKYLLKFDD